MQITEKISAVEINPATKPKTSVIWLHGLGADGYDFASIVQQLKLPEKLAMRFVFPHAPIRPVTLNGGYQMRAWFDVYDLDINAEQDENGIRETQKLMEQLIEDEISLGIISEAIVLAGFSQGASMALHTGLRYPQKLAGILALSGFLPLAELLESEQSSINKKISILMLHGEYDDVIPIEWAKLSRDGLIESGYTVDWKSYPMQHNVCPEEINDISKWLQNLFPI